MTKNQLRIVFFASGNIAVPALEFLIREKYNVICVITAPDRKKGRHLLVSVTPIKEAALKYGLNIFQPENIFSKSSLEYVRNLQPDIFIVFCFGKILSQGMLDIPNKFPLNIHASLLPKYRGAAPVSWALIKGEEKTGITIMKMNEKMDGGDIVLQKEIEIDYLDNAITLEEKIAELSPMALKEFFVKMNSGDIHFLKQNEKEASFAPKLNKKDGGIDWNKKAEDIRNQIRGCLPWPGASTSYKNKLIKIWNVEVVRPKLSKKYSAGVVVDFNREGILVATKDEFLLIKELQPANGKRLKAWDFAQGHKIEKGEKFE